MIIDAFLFLNELEMLEKRFEYLYDTVDYFVIIEATHTHVGKLKPLNYLGSQSRFKKYLDKVIYYPYQVDLSKYDLTAVKNGEFFPIEIDQREYIGTMLKIFPSDSIIIFGDLDEIPIKSKIHEAIWGLKQHGFESIRLDCDMFLYNFKQKQVMDWCGSIVCYNNYIQRVGAQWARSSRVYNASLSNAGYHLSYWGRPEDIKYKLQSFSHTEFDKEEYTSLEKIQKRIDKGEDIFSRQADFNQLIKVNKEEIDQEIYRIFS
jgi:beta-1,4-mannosyl-glycoprotein beta-1,4-N-acetylglucosaminyltransferase